MKLSAIFYHDAGCPVCIKARKQFLSAVDTDRYDVEEVDLATLKERIPEAAEKGVITVPAMVIDDHMFHINRGAELSALL